MKPTFPKRHRRSILKSKTYLSLDDLVAPSPGKELKKSKKPAEIDPLSLTLSEHSKFLISTQESVESSVTNEISPTIEVIRKGPKDFMDCYEFESQDCYSNMSSLRSIQKRL